MIISHKHKFLFVHNPKVGGSSIRKVLAPFHDAATSFWHQGWDYDENRVVDMAHLSAYQWLVDDAVADLFKFGFIRNPYDRFFSALNEFIRRHSDSFPNLTVDKLELVLTPASTRYDWRFVHFCPQHVFFYVSGRSVVDFVGRHEHMERDWAAVSALTGSVFRPKLPIEHERKSTGDQFPPEWRVDRRVIQLVNRLYHRDFLLFGYDMDGPIGLLNTHADRVEVIHNPPLISRFSGLETESLAFTPGEQISLHKRRLSMWKEQT